MSEEIDISKLHGDIKRYAEKADRDKKGSKGSGKLNTAYELNLFKEMVIRNGKQAELKRQLPNIKGVTIPQEDSEKTKKLKDYGQKMKKHVENSIKNKSIFIILGS